MTMTDSHHFASLLALSPSRRGSAVVTFDHLGFGESSVPEPHWGEGSIRGMALDALDVADCASAALGSPCFDLFGVSMGGYIAMSAALERQRQFERGALIESGALRVRALVVGCSHHGGPKMEPITSPYVQTLRELEQHEPRSEGWRRAVRDLYALNFSPAFVHSSPRFAGLLGAFEESCLRDTRAGLAYQNTAVERFYREGMREELAELRLATLIITGDQDSIVPSRNSLLLKQCLPRARLELLRGAGHMFFEEAPERTVDIVANWLERLVPTVG
jgi:pimeloyl-ACP methyl ester carboxylesterase